MRANSKWNSANANYITLTVQFTYSEEERRKKWDFLYLYPNDISVELLADWYRPRRGRTRQVAAEAAAAERRNTRRLSRWGWARWTAWWRIICAPRRGGTWPPGPGRSFKAATRPLIRYASTPFVSIFFQRNSFEKFCRKFTFENFKRSFLCKRIVLS